jgi:hypothetical protein
MQSWALLGVSSLVFAAVASSPAPQETYRHQLLRVPVWPVDLTSSAGNEKSCAHSTILLVREERQSLAVLDLAGRRLIAIVPVKEDGSAVLEVYSAVLHAHLDVSVPAGRGPRVIEVLKSLPALCRYRLAPR